MFTLIVPLALLLSTGCNSPTSSIDDEVNTASSQESDAQRFEKIHSILLDKTLDDFTKFDSLIRLSLAMRGKQPRSFHVFYPRLRNWTEALRPCISYLGGVDGDPEIYKSGGYDFLNDWVKQHKGERLKAFLMKMGYLDKLELGITDSINKHDQAIIIKFADDLYHQ